METATQLEAMTDNSGLVLNLPKADRVRYRRNFIKTAVCELRFPTLLELETKPPRAFQQRIRKLYPFYEPQLIEQVGGAGEGSREQRYLFRSKDKNWTVTVKSSTLGFETSKYVDFEDFFRRFGVILDSAREMIDSDFLTRIGFRYINWIPIEDGNLEGWIRNELIAPLAGSALGPINQFASLIRGKLERGEYAFRQALRREDESERREEPVYILDIDYSVEDIEFNDVPTQLAYFNETNFDFFNWCLGDKAKALLGEGKPK